MSEGQRRQFTQKFAVSPDHLNEKYPGKDLVSQMEEFGRARYGALFVGGRVLDFKRGSHIVEICFWEPER